MSLFSGLELNASSELVTKEEQSSKPVQSDASKTSRPANPKTERRTGSSPWVQRDQSEIAVIPSVPGKSEVDGGSAFSFIG